VSGQISNKVRLGLSIVLAFTLAGCNANSKPSEAEDNLSKASDIIISDKADKARAAKMIGKACQMLRDEFDYLMDEDVVLKFTEASRLDSQYTDELASILYLQDLRLYVRMGAPIEDYSNWARTEELKVVATCRAAGFIMTGF
jgi:hypothetical protein